MIKIKNIKIFTCSIDCNYHWSNLPNMIELMKINILDLRGANLSYANLSYADLCNADLRYADLRYANLSYADLNGAKLKPLNDKKVIIKDFMTVTGLGSVNRQTLIYNTNIGIVVQCGCFYGTEKEFKKKVKETHKGTNYEKEYLEMIKLAKIRFNRGEE